MSDRIGWCVELQMEPGRLDSFIGLTAEMVEHTAREPGVLTYQRFVTADNEFVHVVERYVTSEAALERLRAFQDKFAERFSKMVSRRRFTVYGTPTAELKTVLDGFGATYLSPLGDLAYWP